MLLTCRVGGAADSADEAEEGVAGWDANVTAGAGRGAAASGKPELAASGCETGRAGRQRMKPEASPITPASRPHQNLRCRIRNCLFTRPTGRRRSRSANQITAQQRWQMSFHPKRRPKGSDTTAPSGNREVLDCGSPKPRGDSAPFNRPPLDSDEHRSPGLITRSRLTHRSSQLLGQHLCSPESIGGVGCRAQFWPRITAQSGGSRLKLSITVRGWLLEPSTRTTARAAISAVT